MIGYVTLAAAVTALVVAVVLVIGRPARAAHLLRLSALALTVAVAALLAPYIADDSGAAAIYLLGVPVVAAALPVAAGRFGRAAVVVDVVATIVIVAWSLLLALGVGLAFLPAAPLLISSAAQGFTRRPSATG